MKVYRQGVFETNSSSSHCLTIIKRPEMHKEVFCVSCGKDVTWHDWCGTGWVIPWEIEGIIKVSNVYCEDCLEKFLLGNKEKLSEALNTDLEAILEEGLLDPERQAKEHIV